MPQTNIEPRTRTRARSLRRNPTDAERKMWWLLRSLKPLGMHFRRQAPIGNYIADFAWHTGKIVIELDGSQHATSAASMTNAEQVGCRHKDIVSFASGILMC